MTSYRRAAVRPTREASNTLAAVHGHASSTDEVYESGLMIHVVLSRFHTVGKRPSRTAGRPISGECAW
ncbi:hypothetical protein FBY34_3144 [Streptomyces sp. SLBN-115]|nr:hypothetical protein FBY34_3144 [Streptomyces sp. SLBN-115]